MRYFLILLFLCQSAMAQRFVRKADTASEMISFNVFDINTNIFLAGYVSANDGRGGFFRLVPSVVVTNDFEALVGGGGARTWIRVPLSLYGTLTLSNATFISWKNSAGVITNVLRLNASDEFTIFDLITASSAGGLSVGDTTQMGAGLINSTIGYRIANTAASGSYLRGNGSSFVSGTIQPGDLPAALFANPSTQIGLTAVNGVATTALRSDGAPSLSQSIAPFWTADHIFGAAHIITNVTDPKIRFQTVGTNLVIGLDTSANSDFVISQGTALGTTDIMRVQRDGDKMAWGLGAVAGAANTISIGENAVSGAASAQTILIGPGATATGNDTTVIGYNAIGGLDVNVAIGSGADAGTAGRENVFVGDDSKALSSTVTFAAALGRLSKATNFSTAMGAGAKAYGSGSMAFGYQTDSTNSSSIVMGQQAFSTLTSQLVIGSPGTPIRRVTIGSGPISAAMLDLDFNFTEGVGTDISAEDVTFNAMRPTGSGDGGRFHFFTPTESTVSSSTLAVMAERFTIESTNNLGAKIMLPFDYTGSGLARGLLIQAGSISTGIRLLQGAENAAGNVGGWAETTASGEGAAAGFFGRGFGGTNSYGLVGDATTGQRVEVDGVSVGVVGVASNALGSVIGVLGKLGTNAPAFASGAVVADNGPSLKSIFLGMSNGITKFAVNSTGSITNAGGLAVGGFADPGVGNATIPGVGTIGTVTSALINAPATMVIDPVNDLHILTRYMGIRTVSPDAVLDVWDAGTDRPSALNVQIDDVNVFPLTFYNSSLPAAHGGSPSTGVRFRLSNSGEFKISGPKTNGSMIFNTFDTNRWSVDGTGQFIPQVDNFYDIGRADLRVKTNWNVTVDTTNLLVRSLTATRVPFAAANGEVDDDAGLVYDGTNDRLKITRDAIGSVQSDTYGLRLENSTAAAVGAQQYSPPLVFRGSGWKTDATAASQTVDYRQDVVTVQSTSAPLGYLRFGNSINGAAYNANAYQGITTDGEIFSRAGTASGSISSYYGNSDPYSADPDVIKMWMGSADDGHIDVSSDGPASALQIKIDGVVAVAVGSPGGAQLNVINPFTTVPVTRIMTTKTGDDPIDDVWHFREATTDATVTPIATTTIAASTTYLIVDNVRVRRTGGAAGTADDGAVYIRKGMVTTVAGTVTIFGGTPQDALTQENQAAWDYTWSVSGTTLNGNFTGAVNNNCTIHVTRTLSYVGL